MIPFNCGVLFKFCKEHNLFVKQHDSSTTAAAAKKRNGTSSSSSSQQQQQTYTHIFMCGLGGGLIHCPRNLYPDFLTAYATDLAQRNIVLSVIEVATLPYFKYFADLDFMGPRELTDGEINKVGRKIQAVIRSYMVKKPRSDDDDDPFSDDDDDGGGGGENALSSSMLSVSERGSSNNSSAASATDSEALMSSGSECMSVSAEDDQRQQQVFDLVVLTIKRGRRRASAAAAEKKTSSEVFFGADDSSFSDNSEKTTKKVKTGVHIVMPNLVVTKEECLNIRLLLISNFVNTGFLFGNGWNHWEDILDSNIYNNPNLRMPGSSKISKCSDCFNDAVQKLTCTTCMMRGKVDVGRIYAPSCYLRSTYNPETGQLKQTVDESKKKSLLERPYDMIRRLSVRKYGFREENKYVIDYNKVETNMPQIGDSSEANLYDDDDSNHVALCSQQRHTLDDDGDDNDDNKRNNGNNNGNTRKRKRQPSSQQRKLTLTKDYLLDYVLNNDDDSGIGIGGKRKNPAAVRTSHSSYTYSEDSNSIGRWGSPKLITDGLLISKLEQFLRQKINPAVYGKISVRDVFYFEPEPSPKKQQVNAYYRVTTTGYGSQSCMNLIPLDGRSVCGRHNHNTIYFLISKKGGVTQKCFCKCTDPAKMKTRVTGAPCSRFKSDKVALSDDLINMMFDKTAKEKKMQSLMESAYTQSVFGSDDYDHDDHEGEPPRKRGGATSKKNSSSNKEGSTKRTAFAAEHFLENEDTELMQRTANVVDQHLARMKQNLFCQQQQQQQQ